MRDTGVIRRGAAEVTEAVEAAEIPAALSKERTMSTMATQYKILIGGDLADAAGGGENAARKLEFGAAWVNDHLLPITAQARGVQDPLGLKSGRRTRTESACRRSV